VRCTPHLDVLVVAGPDDQHANAVSELIARRGGQVARLNLSTWRGTSVQWSLDQGLSLSSQGGTLTANSTTAVWWRRTGWVPVEDFAEPEAELVSGEASALLVGVLLAVGPRWVDHPFAVALAEVKLHQLAVASKLGIRVPTSVVTNIVSAAKEFASRMPVVAKPVSSGLGLAPYTALVPDELLLLVRENPTLLQSAVGSTADVRVVTVRGEVFSWRRPRKEDDALDWRQADPHGTQFAAIETESRLVKQSLELARRLSLTFSVQDWLETENGHAFLEVNPQGEWLFLAGAQERLAPTLSRHLFPDE
jgi:hypothetical protein